MKNGHCKLEICNGQRVLIDRQLLFRLSLLSLLQTGITSGSKLVLEFLDSASRINEFQFARIKGVAHIADVDFQLLAGTSSLETVTAAASDLGIVVLGMDVSLHDTFP